MAVDLVSMPSEAGFRPLKRRRLGWDVPDPALLTEAARLQLHLASQLFQVCPSLAASQEGQLTDNPKVHVDSKFGTEKLTSFGAEASFKESGKRILASPPWIEDDEDGHFNFSNGDNLTSRYKILQKMGEGTFGRVLECWDQEAQEVVAVKVVRSAEKYREAAMIEINHLQTLAKNDRAGSRAHKYFRHGRVLNWPDRHTSRESIRAVERLPRLRDLLKKHVSKSSSSLLNLLERMFCYDPLERLTAREALQHPFFQGSMEHYC